MTQKGVDISSITAAPDKPEQPSFSYPSQPSQDDLLGQLAEADPALLMVLEAIESLSLRVHALESLYNGLNKYVGYLLTKDPEMSEKIKSAGTGTNADQQSDA